jgi:hypothetical protein
MATLSQAEIDAILDALCVGLLKRLSCIPSVEIDSHEIDGILKRFTSVNALVDGILRRNPSNQAPAQAVFTLDLIVDDRYPAGNVVTSIDDVVLPPQTDDCHPHPAGDAITSFDAFGQHAEPDLIADDCHHAGDVFTSVED